MLFSPFSGCAPYASTTHRQRLSHGEPDSRDSPLTEGIKNSAKISACSILPRSKTQVCAMRVGLDDHEGELQVKAFALLGLAPHSSPLFVIQ